MKCGSVYAEDRAPRAASDGSQGKKQTVTGVLKVILDPKAALALAAAVKAEGRPNPYG